MPLFHQIWKSASGYETKTISNINQLGFFDECVDLFYTYIGEFFYKKTVIHYGCGSNSGLFSVAVASIFERATFVDYSPRMLAITQKTFAANANLIPRNRIKNYDFVCEKMENYPAHADILIYSYCMSFSEIDKTVSNILNHAQRNTYLLVLETLKALIYEETSYQAPHNLNKIMQAWKKNIKYMLNLLSKNFRLCESKKIVDGNNEPIINNLYKLNS